MTTCRRPRPGFTLLEVLVVTAISLLLVSVSGFIYVNCLKIYKESQGITGLFETSRQINRDLRDYLGSVVPVPGNWITPQTLNFPGQTDTGYTKVSFYYVDFSARQPLMQPNVTYDRYFSGPFDYRPDANPQWSHIGLYRFGEPGTWWSLGPYLESGRSPAYGNATRGWILPGFFGWRSASTATALQNNDIRAGSWGWPRADYRLDASADDTTAHPNVACWFYAEDRYFNSPYTMALDNANVVLVSIKFTLRTVNGKPETQLSFLKHHVCGYDHSSLGGNGMVRGDASYGNMLRSISITPLYLDASGAFRAMDDTALGCALTGANVAGGAEVPRCFDVRYTLMNPANLCRYRFSLRIFCRSNPL